MSTSGDCGLLARSLDVLVSTIRTRGKSVGRPCKPSPQVLQGQGDLLGKGWGNLSVIYWHFPFLFSLTRDERAWALETVCRFYRAYFRSIEIHFPRLIVGRNLDLSCGVLVEDIPGLVKLLKGVCTTPLSRICGAGSEELVPFFGAPLNYLRQSLRRRGTRAINFANDSLQIKNSCPKILESYQSKQLEAHAARMTAPVRQDLGFVQSILKESTNLLIRVKALGYFSLEPDMDVRDLSTRATVESGRITQGGYGHYMLFDGDYDRSSRFRPEIRYFDVSTNGVATYRAPVWPRESELLQDLREIKSPLRKVVGICEPLKVRTITLHHASETNLWGRWQKETAVRLSRLPECVSGQSKLGDDGTPTDFDGSDFDALERARETLIKNGEEPVLVSDDASAATDSIDPCLSSAVCDLTWKNDALGRYECASTWWGTLVYPDGRQVVQTNGQLMGDRRSFPVLCIIHMAAKLAFLRRHGLLENHFFRVNGDDGLIVLPRRLVQDYFSWMERLWVINRTKTYVDPNLFSFNSKLWKRTTRSLVPINRFKIIDCIDKNGNQSFDPRLWNRVLSDCPIYAREKLWKFFCATPAWSKILQSASARGLNWFVPLVAGGLGLTPIGPSFVSPVQKTMILRAFAGDLTFQTRVTSKSHWVWTPRYFHLPKRLGTVAEEPPISKRLKPSNGPTKLLLPRPAVERSWRDVDLVLEVLRSSGVHFCSGGECNKCFLNSPGVSIEHCESCLTNVEKEGTP